MFIYRKNEIFLAAFIIIIMCSLCKSLALNRTKRYIPLLFRDPASITFITGFGIPVHNLNPELVTVGMVFKSPKILPTKFQSLRHPAFNFQKRQVSENEPNHHKTSSGYRILFFKALEELSLSIGLGGRDCVLKMICDLASVPFHNNNGVLGEIIHILLSPSASVDFYGSEEAQNYLKAEYTGLSGQQCHQIFQGCHETILDRISHSCE